MKMRWMLQYVERTRTAAEAEALLPIFREQEGCRGVRVIGGFGFVNGTRVGKEPGIQAFFDYGSPSMRLGLCEGWRAVLVPEALLASCAVMEIAA